MDEAVQQLKQSSRPHIETPRDTLPPDYWIDDYAAGMELARNNVDNRSGTAVKINLEPYDGSALNWYSWIELFKSLVHNTGHTPGEKLAILQRSVK